METEHPLSGKTVVVTRAVDQAAELVEALTRHGASVVHVPTIEIVPPDSWQACDSAIDRLHEFDWVVFASRNGVRFFRHRLLARGGDVERLRKRRTAAVGERTAAELRCLGVPVERVPDRFDAESLVRVFRDDEVQNRTFLVVRAQEGRDVLERGLRARGAHVTAVAAYRTRLCARDVAERLNGQHADVVTFTSPSTFKGFVAAVGQEKLQAWCDRGCALAAIGDVTGRAITQAGFEVDILPQKATVPSLVEAIVEYYR